METVDLRKVEGVIRKTRKDDIARRHRYVKYLTNGSNKLSTITFRIGEKEWHIKSKKPQDYLEVIFTCLLNGTTEGKRPIVKQILSTLARQSLTLEEIKQIQIEVKEIP